MPLLVPFEDKSKDEMKDAPHSGKGLPDSGRQYEHLRKKLKGKFTPGETLIYVYFTTQEGKSFVEDTCWVVRRGDTRNFFSFAWNAYQAARTILDFKDSESSD